MKGYQPQTCIKNPKPPKGGSGETILSSNVSKILSICFEIIKIPEYNHLATFGSADEIEEFRRKEKKKIHSIIRTVAAEARKEGWKEGIDELRITLCKHYKGAMGRAIRYEAARLKKRDEETEKSLDKKK